MTFKNTFKTAIRGLRTNKSRSLLTILGIVIGIAAIIAIMSLGQGAQDLIVKQIQGLGSNTIVVLPGREPSGPSDVGFLYLDSLKQKDFDQLSKKSNVPNLDQIMPIVFGSDTASYEGQVYQSTIMGVSDLVMEMFDAVPSEGAFFGDDDIRSKSDVVVIGAKVKEKLFGGSQAVGEKIKIKDRKYRVLGVLSSKGQVSFFNFDDIILLPYTTAQSYVFGIKYFNRLVIQADSEQNLNNVIRDVELTLRNSHGITDPSKDDFYIQTQADLIETIGIIIDVFTLFLVAVAGISLLVGGIGIMNIMLVSVTERTREIGLRKAVGATNKDILSQFLFEAMALTGAGGIVGIFLGSSFTFLASIILSNFVGLSWSFTFPIGAVLIGLGVSAGVGLVFGIYPAKQAAKKSPIEALRYE
jgi:putative ABC transport system permease protein